MIGVEILNTTIGNNSGSVIPPIIISLSVIIIISLMIFGLANNKSYVLKSIIILIISSIILLPVWITHHNRQFEDYKIHTVTVDDSVSYNEFTEQYSVISKDGKLIKVVEKGTQYIKKEN